MFGRRWFVLALFAAACSMAFLLGASLPARSRPSIKRVNLEVGVYVRVNGRLLQSQDNVELVLNQFGRKPWPRELWTTFSGTPNNDGLLKSAGMFPIDPGFVQTLRQSLDEP